jgi:hypothetical protein
MSNELLPRPDILAASPKQTDHDSEAAEAVANGSGHRLLTEYPNFDSRPEANGDVGAVDRLEAETRDESPEQEPASLADGLAEIAARIRQIEAGLRANDASAPEVHVAVERIHDLALTLRMRDVDEALCDTLDVSVRDVDDAVARNEAAAARAQSAAALLRDVVRRIDQIMTYIPLAAPELESAGQATDVEANDFTRANGAASRPTAHAINGAHAFNGFALDDDHTLPQPSFVHPALPEMQASAEPYEERADPAGPIVLSMPGPLDDNENIEPAHANDEEAESASQPIAVEAEVRGVAASHNGQAVPSVATSSPPAAALNVTAPANSPKSANSAIAPDDPLAALYALSEEELIALFS